LLYNCLIFSPHYCSIHSPSDFILILVLFTIWTSTTRTSEE